MTPPKPQTVFPDVAPQEPSTSTPSRPLVSPGERDYLRRQGNAILAHGGTGQDVVNFARLHVGKTPEERAGAVAGGITETGGVPVQDPNAILGITTKAYQGLTFGFGDEFAGTLSGILPGGRTPQEGRDIYREVLEAGSGSKVVDIIAELAGGVVTGSTAAKAAGLGAGIGSGVIGAGVGGAVASAGFSEGSVSDRAKSALVGGLIGTALGTGFGAAGAVAAPIVRQPIRRAMEHLGKVGRAIQHRLPSIGTSEDHARRVLVEVLEGETNLTPEQRRLGVTVFDVLRDRANALRDAGVSPTIVDAGGESMLALMGEMVSSRTPAKQRLVEQVFARQAAQGERLTEGLFQSIFRGDKFGLTNAYHAVDDLAIARRRVGSPLYEAAHREMVPISDKTKRLIQGNPRLRAAYEEGLRIAQAEDLTTRGQAMLEAGRLEVPSLPSGSLLQAAEQDLLALNVPPDRIQEMLAQLPDAFPDQLPVRAIDYMQQGLRKVRQRLERSGSGLESKELILLNETVEEILEEATSASPTFRQAREAWAGMSAAMDAVEMGRDLSRKAPEIIEKEIAALESRGSGLSDFYRLGAMQDIVERVRDLKAVEDAASNVFGADLIRGVPSNGTTRRLQALFGDEAKASDFFRRAAAEARLSRTAQVPGSTRPRSGTAFQEAEQRIEGPIPFGRGGSGATMALLNAWSIARQRMVQGTKDFRTRVADDISAFMARGLDSPEALDTFIDSLEDFQMRQNLQREGRERVRMGLSSILGVGIGRLLGGPS